MITETFDFEGAAGRRLSGRLEAPDGAPRGWGILAHCFTCGKDGLAASRITRALAANGIGMLRFDFGGLGSSEGSFSDTTFTDNVEDLMRAAQAMAAAGKPASILVGHSLGGSAVLEAADRTPDVRAVVTIGSPFDVTHVLHQFDAPSLDAIERDGAAPVQLAGRSLFLGKRFVSDLGGHDLGGHIAHLNRPILVLHAPRDATVGVDNAAKIFGAAKHPKSFVSLDDADHLLTRRADAEYAASTIAAWAGRYLA